MKEYIGTGVIGCSPTEERAQGDGTNVRVADYARDEVFVFM
jgi:hypothetical protein